MEDGALQPARRAIMSRCSCVIIAAERLSRLARLLLRGAGMPEVRPSSASRIARASFQTFRVLALFSNGFMIISHLVNPRTTIIRNVWNERKGFVPLILWGQ